MAEKYAGIDFRYAGFWLRLVSSIIDAGILLILVWILSLVYGVSITSPSHTGDDFVIFRLFELTSIFAAWIYFAVMESSLAQATIGKLFIGIYVTDMDGDRLAFSRASIRYWLKYLTIFTFLIGFLISAFTKKKQTVHDMIVKSLVLKR